MSLDEKLTRMKYLRDDYRRLDAEANALKAEYKLLEEAVLQELQDTGMTQAGNTVARASMSEEVLPTVDPVHWDEVHAWLLENGYTDCLPKKLNSSPIRELWAMGIEIPHVTGYTKHKLSLTSNRQR